MIKISKKRIFTESEIRDIKQLIEEGKTSKNEVARKYNMSPRILNSLIAEHNIKWIKRTGRIKTLHSNEAYFNKIDSEEKAYWLGFLMADGYVAVSGDVGISLAIVDEKHLEKFKKAVSFEGNVLRFVSKSGYSVGKEYCRIVIRSRTMKEDLSKHNLVEKKTDILSPPPNLAPELIRHFIRGYVDGDGSIAGLKRKTYSLKIVGTENILRYIENHLPTIVKGRALETRREGQTVRQMSISGSDQLRRCLDWLYLDSNVYLDRKYQKYLEVINELSCG